MTIRFNPKADLPVDGFLRVRAPLGVNWDEANLQFSTDPVQTQANAFSTGVPILESSDPVDNTHRNVLVVRISAKALAGFEYGLV